MEQAEGEQLRRFLRHGISNFLAGTFFIVTGFRFTTDGIDVRSAQYMSWIIGGVLIFAAFSLMLAVFIGGRGYGERIEKWGKRLEPVLYTVSMIQLIFNFVLLYVDNLVFLVTITGIFLLVVLVAVIYMTRRMHILDDIPSLMVATLMFVVVSVTLMFIGASMWQIIPYGLIGIALLLMTIRKYEKAHMKK